ncbi:MAG: hypothetical protein U1E50_00285 [Caulobacteraceae bacterium]
MEGTPAAPPGRQIKTWEIMGAVGAAAQALVGVFAWLDGKNNGEGAKFMLEQITSALFIVLFLVVALVTAGRAIRKMPLFGALQQWLGIWAVIAGATWMFLALGWFEPGGNSGAQAQPPPKVAAAPAAPAAPVTAVVAAPPPEVYVAPPSAAQGVETADSQEAFVRSGAAQAADSSLLARPSFDCASVQGAAELAICGDEALARMDRLVAMTYVRRLDRGDAVARETQNAWLGARNAACGADAICLKRMMSERMRTLQSAPIVAPAAPPPAPAATPGTPAAPR